MNNNRGFLDKPFWMSKTLGIEQLKLTDIVWSGFHNCGMDKKAPNHEALVGNWTNCQNDTFLWQLANGARAFDIRLGYDAGTSFYFHHNGFRSGHLLEELIDALLLFLDRNPDEFIVLDFHQLGDGDKYFWPRIPHKWHESTFSAPRELQRYIAQTLEDVPYETFLWSLSATTYSLLGGPGNIKRQINDWFNTTGNWVTRCSIISTDFFDESDIVRYCWSATSMKAVYGRALHEQTHRR